MSYLRTPVGGYKRIEGSTDPYDTDEWTVVDLRASDAFRRAGNASRADELLGWVTAQATANHGLIPELYNTSASRGSIGAYAGAAPMVGFGAAAYELTMLDRAALYEQTDCGETDVTETPDAGLPGGVTSGNEVACACQGGPGSGGTGFLFGLVGLLVLRRRRR
jgi:MYXO-CTERM domain-containing protein